MSEDIHQAGSVSEMRGNRVRRLDTDVRQGVNTKISIIIPMRNEERYVSACLDSVLDQLGSMPDCEVLCVDGASTDRTRQIVSAYVQRDSRIRLVDNPQGIVPTGMNKAIRLARGDVILRLDCHARYAGDYIKNSVEVLHRTGAENAVGYCTTLPGRDSAVGRAIAAATSSRFGVGNAVFRTGGGEQEVDTGAFGCFRREVFERFGLYDERLVRNQDIELNNRIRKDGGRIIISPSIRYRYYTRSTFSGLRQQSFYNGLWNPYTLYLVGGSLQWRHHIPLFFVGSIIGLVGLGFFHPLFLFILAGELILYLLVACFMAYRVSEKDPKQGLLIMLAFIQLHVAYGIGSLWGLITAPFKFGFRKKRVPGQVLPDRRD